MADLRLCYTCPIHGSFFIRLDSEAFKERERQCPSCGALSQRDFKYTTVIND